MALLYWNKNTLQDQAIIWLGYSDSKSISIDTNNGYTLIKESNGKVLGINIEKASTFLNLKEGAQTINQQIVKSIKDNLMLDLNQFDLETKLIVGQVTKRERHPKSNKLFLLTTQADEELQIVTNSINSTEGTFVVVAKLGALLPSGMIIKPAKVMGVKSQGMLCGGETLGLAKTDGIYIPNGMMVGQKFTL